MASRVLVADVLGFSRLVSNLDHEALESRIGTWVDLIEDISRGTEVRNIQVISDTLFVQEDGCASGLERLLLFSKNLLEHGLANSFPIRGAISEGDVTWGKLTYGKALIKGHTLERLQD